jgi:hypothetical protein
MVDGEGYFTAVASDKREPRGELALRRGPARDAATGATRRDAMVRSRAA